MNDDEKKSIIDHVAQRQAPMVRACIRQSTGKQYHKLETELLKLSGEALLELGRLLSDLEQNVTRAKNQVIHQPWRR